MSSTLQKIVARGDEFLIPGAWTPRVKSAPDRQYHAAQRFWRMPNSKANQRHIRANFSRDELDDSALRLLEAEIKEVEEWPPLPTLPPDLLLHQQTAIAKAWGRRQYAFFHEMGSGKSRTLLEMWRVMYHFGLANEFWIICPNSIIDNWHEQIAKWTPDLTNVVQVFGVLSLSAGKLPKELVLRAHRGLAVAVDESQRIKNSQAVRTKVVQEIGKNAGFRYILTGTSITKGIQDLYAQYGFLDPAIVGHRSYFTFRNHYCVMGGFEGKQITGYQNVNELVELVAPWTDVVENPVQLPSFYRETRKVALSTEQKRLIDDLKEQMSTEMAGETLTVNNVLTYYTRASQIIGGFFPLEGNRTARLRDNPKLDELVEIMEGTTKKVVVFCRFVAEASLIETELMGRGYQPARIRPGDDRLQEEVNRFQNDPDCRVIISTYSAGSVGFTLTAGKLLVKYSGTFNYEEEAQSERRIWRIGQDEEVSFIRIKGNNKLETAIEKAYLDKGSLANFIVSNIKSPKAMLSLLDID